MTWSGRGATALGVGAYRSSETAHGAWTPLCDWNSAEGQIQHWQSGAQEGKEEVAKELLMSLHQTKPKNYLNLES